jgi:hypothetical protein
VKFTLNVILLLIFTISSPAQKKFTDADAEKKKEEIKEKQNAEYEQKRQDFLKHQLAIQSKATQKRMIANQKLTNRYYRKCFCKSIFQTILNRKQKQKKYH